MDIYYSPVCGNSKRVLFAMAELGIEADRHLIDLSRGEHRAPAYLAVNPLGKVPALVDGDHILWESMAIALYLAEQRPDRGLLPASPADRAELHKWLFLLAHEVHYPATPDMAARVLPVLEQQLAGRAYLLGTFGIADIAWAPALALFQRTGFELPPRVAAWTARIFARPAWRAIAEEPVERRPSRGTGEATSHP